MTAHTKFLVNGTFILKVKCSFMWKRRSKSPRRRKRRSRLRDLMWTILFFGLLAFFITRLDLSSPEKFIGPAIAIDGDSLLIADQRLRLDGIDAPELAQSCTKNGKSWRCGQQSRNVLKGLLKQGVLHCISTGQDKYDRTLVSCEIISEFHLNQQMVQLGWAVDYGGYAREEAQARRNRLGIWAGEFDRPQDWRREHRADTIADQSTDVLSKLRIFTVEQLSRLSNFLWSFGNDEGTKQ